MEIMLIVGYAAAAVMIVAYVLAVRARSPRLVRGALVAASVIALIRVAGAAYLWWINWAAAADVVMVALPAVAAAGGCLALAVADRRAGRGSSCLCHLRSAGAAVPDHS
jgi:hypothetical protein